MSQLADVSVYVNPVVVAICLVLGKMIKSSSVMKKIPNDTIPFILMAISIVVSFVLMGFSGDALCSGIFSAAAAVGIHQQGKQGFKTGVTGIDEDLELLKDDASEDEVSPDEEVKG